MASPLVDSDGPFVLDEVGLERLPLETVHVLLVFIADFEDPCMLFEVAGGVYDPELHHFACLDHS